MRVSLAKRSLKIFVYEGTRDARFAPYLGSSSRRSLQAKTFVWIFQVMEERHAPSEAGNDSAGSSPSTQVESQYLVEGL